MLAAHPCTLHFKVQNKPVPGLSPKTTENFHLSVPVELRIAGSCIECVHKRVCDNVSMCMQSVCINLSNKMTENRRSLLNWTL